jgi:hypothetical protein
MLKEGNSTTAEVEERAYNFFKANTKGSTAVFTAADFKVTVDKANSKVEVTLAASIPTAFARVGGINDIPLPQKSTAVFAVRDIEVGLALDVTGSMSDPAGGGKTKMQALKSAFAKFAALMLPVSPNPGQKVRLGLAPYSASMNLGPYAVAASNNRSADGCVTERTTGARYRDDSPLAGGFFKVKADGATDIDGYQGNSGYACPTAVLQPLTDDRAKLIASVNAYSPGGATGGQFGAQWAWNIVSPEWSSVWGGSSAPDAYSKVADKKLVKAVIFMTDGDFNTAWHNDTSNFQALKLCEGMKAKGIQVFSLGFAVSPAAKKLLIDCASPGSEYYADATNEAELDTAFNQFAGKINALRLAQ